MNVMLTKKIDLCIINVYIKNKIWEMIVAQ